MDMDLQTALLVIGAIVIVIVLVHGYVTMRRRNELRIKLDRSFMGNGEPDENDLDLLRAELPNGGARVVSVTSVPPDSTVETQDNITGNGPDEGRHEPVEVVRESPATLAPAVESGSDADAQAPVASDDIPVLVESMDAATVADFVGVSVGATRRERREMAAAPVAETKTEQVPVQASLLNLDVELERPDITPEAMAAPDAGQPANDDAEVPEVIAETPGGQEAGEEQPAKADGEGEAMSAGQIESNDSDAEPGAGDRERPIVLSVLANDQPFSGRALRQALEALDMTHGEMAIFHRLDALGTPEFSMANAVEPGTFDPEVMDQTQTQGVTLFMMASRVDDPASVFENMLMVAQMLADELGGSVKDERLVELTTKSIDQRRQTLRRYRLRQA